MIPQRWTSGTIVLASLGLLVLTSIPLFFSVGIAWLLCLTLSRGVATAEFTYSLADKQIIAGSRLPRCSHTAHVDWCTSMQVYGVQTKARGSLPTSPLCGNRAAKAAGHGLERPLRIDCSGLPPGQVQAWSWAILGSGW